MDKYQIKSPPRIAGGLVFLLLGKRLDARSAPMIVMMGVAEHELRV
jgi:hypothetical protein